MLNTSRGFYFLLQIDPIRIGPYQYACPYCQKIMNRGFLIRRHMKTHTGEKPYACEYCNYRTIQKNDLKKHCQTKHFLQ